MSSPNIESEYFEIALKNAWPAVYHEIGRECQAYKYTCVEAKKITNKNLNRYRDVNPYDHSRVVLKRCDSDYINANLVQMDRANRKYILTQGPLASTVGHFWLMVWEQNSRAILMLNKIIEKNEIKCFWYWPRGVGEAEKLVLDDVKLTVEMVSEDDSGHYTTRVLRIYDMESTVSREVIQFHYTTWPDFGVPSSPVAFLEFLSTVRASGALEPEVGPAIVHCSAGIGRSGTFCLVDSCLVIIEREGIESIKVREVLLEMRKDRMGLIQTPDQLRFSYIAIIEGFRKFRSDADKSQSWDFNESFYSVVNDETEEDSPPPPPPRAESLTKAPARPLPAIPASASLGNLNYTGSAESSSSEDEPPQVPKRNQPSPGSSADDEDDEPTALTDSSSGIPETLRRRRRELADRISVMKKRGRNRERLQRLKRSLYKHLTITFGFILAGVVIYTYVKH